MKNIFFFLIVLAIASSLAAQNADTVFKHPRGIINISTQQTIRERVQREPYKSLLSKFEKKTLENVGNDQRIITRATAYGILQNMLDLAFLHTMTAQQTYADQAFGYIDQCTSDSGFWLNPMSFGLSRARFLRICAIVYDLCFNAWNTAQRQKISQRLIDCAFSINSTFGFEANYAQESNWMGVRYGAIFLATFVADDYSSIGGRRSPLNALNWDSRERLRDHIRVNINPNGWSAESLGYHFFAWSFITPAIAAFQNNLPGNKATKIENYAPHALNSVLALTSSIVNIAGANGKGVKADLSDDNLGISPDLFLQVIPIYPASQLPVIKWMVDYLKDENLVNSIFYYAAYYPEDIQSENPATRGLLNYIEPLQGAVVFRNRFQDENDIVATFTTTSKRVRAHQSGDNLTFRILGLDNIWVIGAGRTGQYAGQTNLFPFDTISKKGNYISGSLGKLLDYKFLHDGSGFAKGTGSCMGVEDHIRYFQADYSKKSGAEAVFVINDQSKNGKTWRLNTPEFNKVESTADGFMITAPNGATLKAIIINGNAGKNISTTTLRYGGDTRDNVAGIGFKGKYYANTTAIDSKCNGNIMVVITLQPGGKPHPAVVYRNNKLSVGSVEIFKE
jgi:hypothetical protein